MLLCYILGFEPEEIAKKRPDIYGFVVENFVATELIKQLSLLSDGKLYHFRTQNRKEIDFIIQKRNGEMIAIEVKAANVVSHSDFKHIEYLQSIAGKDFLQGIILYQGNKILSFGNKCCAMPISALWEI